jgi:hypothetical protein
MFQGTALARERKSLFSNDAIRYEAEKRSDNLEPDVFGLRLYFR